MEIEEQDARILNALQQDGRMSNQDLAQTVGMSTSACWRRVRALEERGNIRRYSAIIDHDATGLEFHAILHIVLTRHEPDCQQEFVRAVTLRDEVLDCYQTTGDADYHLRVRCRNKAEYNRFLDDFVFKLRGISNVRTNLVLKELKHQAGVILR